MIIELNPREIGTKMNPTKTIFTTMNEALAYYCNYLLNHGVEVDTRAGRVKEATHITFTVTNPDQRYFLNPARRASLPTQIAETMWVLAGRSDLDFLKRYLPQAPKFSDDDGLTWRGAYGPRIRAWETRDGETVDQLAYVVQELKENPNSRRAVITLWDPAVDTAPGLDIPCNNWLSFHVRDGGLHMNVATRSNDLMWGWSGINAFEWSVLQQVIAEMLGVKTGIVTYNITNLHLYEHHWRKAQDIVENGPRFGDRGNVPKQTPIQPAPRFFPKYDDGRLPTIQDLDTLVRYGMNTLTAASEGKSLGIIHVGGSELLRSWMSAVSHWWGTNTPDFGLGPSDVWRALEHSPKAPSQREAEKPQQPASRRNQFLEEVKALHRDKHAAYGDSWKRRGETLGILANIARKVDRLGVSGGGDTAADTAIDLWVYLCKYRSWIEEGSLVKAEGEVERVEAWMEATAHRYLSGDEFTIHDELGVFLAPGRTSAELEADLQYNFERLSHYVESGDNTSRNALVWKMSQDAFAVALHAWIGEKREAWKAGNETRFWKGYDA